MNKMIIGGPSEPEHSGDLTQLGYVANELGSEISDDADVEAVNADLQGEVEYFFWQLRQRD